MEEQLRRQTRSSKRKDNDVVDPVQKKETDFSEPRPGHERESDSSESDPSESNPSQSDLSQSVPPRDQDETDAAKPVKNPEKAHSERQKGNYMYIVTVLVVVVGSYLAMLVFAGNRNSFGQTDDIDIENSLIQLASDFKSQSPLSFKKLESRALTYVHHKTSPQPFVLMVAAMPDDQPTADCFVKRVAKMFAKTSVTINGSKYSNTQADDAKLKIDDSLRNVFQEGKFPTAAIIHNLDMVPYGTTTLFYAYCDHENPMYKEAAIIFTVTLPQSYEMNANEHDRERLVEKYLAEDSPWVNDEAFSLDVMGALISRITDIVIVVNKESREALEKVC